MCWGTSGPPPTSPVSPLGVQRKESDVTKQSISATGGDSMRCTSHRIQWSYQIQQTIVQGHVSRCIDKMLCGGEESRRCVGIGISEYYEGWCSHSDEHQCGLFVVQSGNQ